jgi:transposase
VLVHRGGRDPLAASGLHQEGIKKAHRGRAVGHLQFLQQSRDVAADRGIGDEETLGHLGGAQALTHQFEHLPLPAGQLGTPLFEQRQRAAFAILELLDETRRKGAGPPRRRVRPSSERESRRHTTFTETCDSILPRATHTRRFDRYLAARATEEPYAHVAEEEGVAFYRVDKASRLAAQRLLESRMSSPPTRLCIDEQSHRRGQIYNTIFSDSDGRRVIDLIEGRRQAPVQDFLDSLSNQIKAGIQEVVIDMFEPYRRAVTLALPNARLVLDRFHTERVVTKALDKVRRDLQQQLRRPGRNQGYNPPRRKLFYARHKLMRGKRRLTLTDLEELAELFTDYPELECAWQLVWRFRLIYAAADRQQAFDLLHQWYSDVDESGLLPFVQGDAAVIRAWEDEFLAYFDSRLTNAYAEGITNKIKVIKSWLRLHQLRQFPTARARGMRMMVRCWAGAHEAESLLVRGEPF